MFNRSFPFAVAGLLISVSSTVVAQDYKPQIAEASNDATLALQGFVLPDGMSGSLLAAEPLLANPVAFYVANDGRVFVCETFRQGVGVEDNRNHMDWLDNDLRLETVEERLAMFKKHLGDDVQKYATQHDRIRVLKDTNGDGTFDDDAVFAQGFNDILDGTGAGVLEHDGKVYYTCIPKLWMLEDTDGDSVADNIDALHHGYGVRVAFRGHDMHGLTMGPDGRLYFSIGDRGFNVITQEGTRLKRVDSGAVFRCDTDGSHLEVFAYGLRNPQELAFDDHGNLWTGDNNSDSGDLARWVYVVQDGDTGWRMYFQYLEDRGPWNRERMWYPYRADDETTAVQPAYIVPPVANLGDGPSGLTYYPGLGLSERYNNHFFMADFRGGAGNSGIRSFSVKPKGATFELTDSHEFLWSILGTDVDFAPDGSLYVTDWVNGWVGEGKGRLYRFADDEHISAVAGANVPNLLNGGIAGSETSALVELLSHADRRVRQQAQFALAKRDAREELITAATSADLYTQLHGTWGLWQLGLKSSTNAQAVADVCIQTSDNPEVSVQRLRVITDLVKRHGVDEVLDTVQRESAASAFRKLLDHENLRVAGFAAVALGTIGHSEDKMEILDLVKGNNDLDPVVRHQCVMGLSKLEQRDRGTLLLDDMAARSVAERMAILLCLRRETREEIRLFLDDSDPGIVAEAARAITEQGTDAALNDLSFRLILPASNPRAITDASLVRRALEASYRLGAQRHAMVVSRTAADDQRDEAIRVVAAEMLKTWNAPQQTDTVTGRWRPLPKREVANLNDVLSADVVKMMSGPDPVRRTAVELAGKLQVREAGPLIRKVFEDKEEAADLRAAAFRSLAELSTDKQELLKQGLNDPSEAIRIAGLELMTREAPTEAVPQLAATLKSGSVAAQQTALKLLGSVNSAPAVATLEDTFQQLNSGKLNQALALDVLNAASQQGGDDLTQHVREFRNAQVEAGTKLALWSECLEGGNAERGKSIFFGRAAASCRRCHKVNGDGADVGPDLSAVAKDRDRSYLLEAIVDPSAKIAKGFETTIIVDIDGKIHSGIIKEETDELVKLMTPKGAIITVAKDDIDDRSKGLSGMPADIAKNLSRDEIRDLVEYLSTLRKNSDSAAHGNKEASAK